MKKHGLTHSIQKLYFLMDSAMVSEGEGRIKQEILQLHLCAMFHSGLRGDHHMNFLKMRNILRFL
jgi:hypothetical protein